MSVHVSIQTYRPDSGGSSISHLVLCMRCAASLSAALLKSEPVNCVDLAGKGKLKNSAFRDLWFHFILDFLLFASIGVGVWQLVAGAQVISPLLISVLWAVYAAVPPTLLLYYATLGQGYVFQILCK